MMELLCSRFKAHLDHIPSLNSAACTLKEDFVVTVKLFGFMLAAAVLFTSAAMGLLGVLLFGRLTWFA